MAPGVLRGRWFVLLGAILIMLASGGTYVFGIYSKAIQMSLSYDQKALTLLSTLKNLGGSLGIVPGLLYDYELAPTWFLLLFGAGMNLLGYLPIYLAVTKRIAPPPTWVVRLCITFGAASQSFSTTGAIVSTVRNFPDNRGGVLGVLTGYGGLSGGIFAQLHHAFFDGPSDNGAGLLVLLASLPTLISVLFAFFIRVILGNTGDPAREDFRGFVGTSLGLALGLLVMSIVELKVQGIPNYTYYVVVTVLLLAAIVVLVAVVIKLELRTNINRQRTTPTSPILMSNNTADTPFASAPRVLREPVAANRTSSSWFRDVFRPPARGEDYSIMQALFSLDMLLIVIIATCGVSGLLTAMDNLGQIGESLGYDQGTISMLVSLANISSYVGRVVGGFGSEYLVGQYNLPRPSALTVTLVPACVAHLIVAFGVSNGLYAASLVMGFCLGAQWPVLFAIISEVFGLKHFSKLYNLVPLATTPGCYILNVLLTGRLYDQEAQRQGGQCRGVKCFKVSFLAIAGSTVIGAVASLVLAWTTSNFYGGRCVTMDDASNDDGDDSVP